MLIISVAIDSEGEISVSAIFGEMLISTATADQNNFQKLIKAYSVSRLAIDISTWLEASVKSAWLDNFSSSFPEMPSCLVQRIDIAVSFFLYLSGKKVDAPLGYVAAHYSTIADQLLVRLIDLTFALCRNRACSKPSALPFLSISMGSNLEPLSDLVEINIGTDSGAFFGNLQTSGAKGLSMDENAVSDESLSCNLLVLAMVKMISRIAVLSVFHVISSCFNPPLLIFCQLPRRKSYMKGFIEEGILVATSTCSWALTLAIVHFVLTARVDAGDENGET